MFTKTIIKRTTETNSDVSNTPPTAKQDCSDVVHISVFFDGTGNNKDADEEKRNGQIQLGCGNLLISMHKKVRVMGVSQIMQSMYQA